MEHMFKDMDDDPVSRAVNQCSVIQSMIELTAKRLDALRTICSTMEEITQQEIKETEGKLISLFSKQLVAKSKLLKDEVPSELQDIPRTKQWLKIVGVDQGVIEGSSLADVSLETLVEMSENELGVQMGKCGAKEDQVRRLSTALHKLKLCTERHAKGILISHDDLELHWTSYHFKNFNSTSSSTQNSPKMPRTRPSTSSLPTDSTFLDSADIITGESPANSRSSSPAPVLTSKRRTPPPTPPFVRPKRAPATPPPKNKIRLHPDGYPLQKSKSHESHLFTRLPDADGIKYLSFRSKRKPHDLKLTGSHEALGRRRHSGEERTSSHTSPIHSPPYRYSDQYSLPDDKTSLKVPRSPKTPCSMSHSINHRFTNMFKITTCDYCHKQMVLGFKCKECKFETKVVFGATCDYCHKHVFEIRGKMCKYCKYKCHKDCAAKVAPACGLPEKYVDVFMDSLRDGSPSAVRKLSAGTNNYHTTGRHAGAVFHGHDSSSNPSSCDSSTPSSPATMMSQPSPLIHVQNFNYPDIEGGLAYGHPEITTIPPEAQNDDNNDNISVRRSASSGSSCVRRSSSSGSEKVKKRVRWDFRSISYIDVVNTTTSNESNDSDKTLIDSTGSGESKPPLDGGSESLDRFERYDSIDSNDDTNWKRQNSISVTLREWDIPFEEVVLDDVIGRGRYGSVHRGNWHGEIAVKFLNMDECLDNAAQLAAFKLEVANLRKTRHENLVLFMGACMKPPHLAIVTSYCKGKTLYTHLHVRGEKFQMNKTVMIASQVTQGMAYLHAKGIIHKDLKTKNVFLDGGKVIITDFGLFSVTKLCQGNRKGDWLVVPRGWLSYLSPEIVQVLTAVSNADLPFSEASDVYAFGTLWYELLSADFPFKKQPAESIIWQVGRGLKQSLGRIQASRDVKEILMMCWSQKAITRPSMSELFKALEKLPKKRLARSPSHPVQLSRSAESVI